MICEVATTTLADCGRRAEIGVGSLSVCGSGRFSRSNKYFASNLIEVKIQARSTVCDS